MFLKYLLFACVFLFISCADDEFNNPDDPYGVNYMGGGSTINSSGSTNYNIVYGSPVTYEGETYQTVVIGTQIWFKRNLNYAALGSKCYGNVTANCATYGRLYDWTTAMALPASCKSSFCGYSFMGGHQGICPLGWYIPNYNDYLTLMTFVNSSCGEDYGCVAKTLKSANLWVPKGTDNYGFSALPGGGYYYGDFEGIGTQGVWWSSYENDAFNASGWAIYDNVADMVGYASKDEFYSVRCVATNYMANVSSSSRVASSSSATVYSSSRIASSSSSFTPNCSLNGGTVTIGEQVWMAENLNCDIKGSKCYDNDGSNCYIYGRLYDWATAMALPASCNSTSCASQIKAKHRGICPSGWHIPSEADWDDLMTEVGGSYIAGLYLKASYGWYEDGNGEDMFSFAALPGGFFDSYNEEFGYVLYNGSWWGSTENIYDTQAYGRYMNYDEDEGGWYYAEKADMFSIRCLKD